MLNEPVVLREIGEHGMSIVRIQQLSRVVEVVEPLHLPMDQIAVMLNTFRKLFDKKLASEMGLP